MEYTFLKNRFDIWVSVEAGLYSIAVCRAVGRLEFYSHDMSNATSLEPLALSFELISVFDAKVPHSIAFGDSPLKWESKVLAFLTERSRSPAKRARVHTYRYAAVQHKSRDFTHMHAK